LRRSIQVSLRYSTIASQFTQSEAKGRTLHVPLFGQLFLAVFTARIRRWVPQFFAFAAWNRKPNRIVAVQECDARKADRGTNGSI